MPKGREKGYKRPQAEIDKARMTRIVNRNKKAEIKVIGKPVLTISRKWQTGFDFWSAMRNVLRPLHRYADCRNIERMIVQKDIWENREEIIRILENYFILQLKNLKLMYNIDRRNKMKDNWYKMLQEIMESDKEDFSQKKCTLSDDELKVDFDSGFSGSEGQAFTAWGKKWVYFPIVYDGSEWIGHAPRFPCKISMSHQGGE